MKITVCELSNAWIDDIGVHEKYDLPDEEGFWIPPRVLPIFDQGG